MMPRFVTFCNALVTITTYDIDDVVQTTRDTLCVCASLPGKKVCAGHHALAKAGCVLKIWNGAISS